MDFSAAKALFTTVMFSLGMAFQPRYQQVEVVWRLLDGQDVVALLPTGFGKSLVYQVFSQLNLPQVRGRFVLVISPLRGLVRDQIGRCEALEIRAAELAMNGQKQLEGMNPELGIMFASPEAVVKNRRYLQKMENRVSLLVYDEAHCISSWGIGEDRKAFREAYAETQFLKAIFGNKIPTLCLSATMDQKVLDDVKSNLKLGVSRPCVVIGEASDRPNIYFSLESGKVSKKVAFSWIVDGIRSEKTSFRKTVIFVSDPSSAADLFENFTLWLGKDAFSSGGSDKSRALMFTMYTGQVGREHQDYVMQSFRYPNSVIRLVICTVAFGMGMDIPDIRNVVHWGKCDKVVSYWQEVGRIGRDGCPSFAYIIPSVSTAKDVFEPLRNPSFNQCIRYFFLSKLCPESVGKEYVRSLLSRVACDCDLPSCECSSCHCCCVCRGRCKCRIPS